MNQFQAARRVHLVKSCHRIWGISVKLKFISRIANIASNDADRMEHATHLWEIRMAKYRQQMHLI